MSTGSIKNRIQQNNSELEDTIDTVEDLPDYLDTSDANATANDILLNKTAYVNGVKLEGTFSYESAGTISPAEYDTCLDLTENILGTSE